MNTNDLNARSSLTRRQRRTQAPRVECLESRELMAYPAFGVAFQINQALFHHKNTAAVIITGVNSSLRNDLAGPSSPLASLTATFTTTGLISFSNANTFEAGVQAIVANYEGNAAAQLSPRFPFVYGSIFTHAQNILNGVVFHTGVFEAGQESSLQYFQSVTFLVTH
jgi:hypothetical protein